MEIQKAYGLKKQLRYRNIASLLNLSKISPKNRVNIYVGEILLSLVEVEHPELPEVNETSNTNVHNDHQDTTFEASHQNTSSHKRFLRTKDNRERVFCHTNGKHF